MARGPHPSQVALAVALVCSLGLFLLGRSRIAASEDRDEKEATAVLFELSRDIETALRSAQGRAAALANSQTLRSAVATDQKTVADMVARDFTLTPRQDETMELFQVPRGGGPLSLLRQPADGPPSPAFGTRGAVLSPSGEGVLVTVAVPIEPLYRKEELGGTLAITLRVDAHRLSERLGSRDIALELSGLSAPLLLGRAGRKQRMQGAPLSSPPQLVRPLSAQLSLPRGKDGGLRIAALGAGFLGLLLAGVLRRRRKGAAAEVAATTADGSGPRGAETSGMAATLTGLIAGKYRLGAPIGAGGMSEVFLAQAVGEASFEKRVAVKFLRPAFAETSILDYFLDEARLQAKISHPNVVQIYDLGRDGKSYFIAMEYVDGLDGSALLHRLEARKERLPLQLSLTIGIAACEGLHAAHTATDAEGKPLSLIHRDVKPSNLLIGYNGSVKVADFGIAKADQQAHLTVPGQVTGTLSYMAPEQRAGGVLDRRVDVFGMGAVIYELCTGQRIDLDLARLLLLGLKGWPHLVPPSQLLPELPKELDEILWRALSYEAKDRYPDCRALGAALEAVLIRAGTTPSASALAGWLEERRG